MNYWTELARRHWQIHLPDRYVALDDPDASFHLHGQEAAARYEAVRDGLLEGVNPNNGTVGWSEFQDQVAQADQTAHEIVTHELTRLIEQAT